MNNYNELKTCLKDLKDKILQKEERKRTLMDITGIDHLENNWSKIYAYFFDSQEDHHMGSKFVKALLEVCGIDNNFLDNPYVYLEQPGEDNKRMDILLVQGEHAVIIENKVHHVLNNDLGKYYAKVRKHCNDVKVVVLGLHKYYVKSFEYANKDENTEKIQPLSITHIDLMEKMNEVFEANVDIEQWKFNYLFNEFYQNIKNMTNESIKKELDIFTSCDEEERTKIYEIAMVYNKLISYLDKQMKCKTLDIDGVKLTGKHENDYVKYIVDGTDENMMLTILYRDRLLIPDKEYKKPHILVVLELQGDYRRDVKQEDYNSFFNAKIKRSKASDDDWMHFAYTVYNISINEAFENPNVAKDVIEGCGIIELVKEIKKHQS